MLVLFNILHKKVIAVKYVNTYGRPIEVDNKKVF